MSYAEETIAKSVTNVLIELGWDLRDESIQGTPIRFAKYLLEFHQQFDPQELLGNGFDRKRDNVGHDMVIQSHIPFRMCCEHHLLPATGRAAIGYVPEDRVVGLSKLTRLVQAVGTERPSLQESICHRICDVLTEHLKPKGTMVVIKAEHGCMACRGVNSPRIMTTTSAIHGVFRDVPQARAEFLSLIGDDLNG